eukprot:m.23487 g.23487  ORF g.23487 m.23487 type:complete len:490 (-) comp13178_c0_seq1:105-1574(-)
MWLLLGVVLVLDLSLASDFQEITDSIVVPKLDINLTPTTTKHQWEWQDVKQKLATFPLKPSKPTQPWVEQLHVNPDVFLLHNYLSTTECQQLLALHDQSVRAKKEESEKGANEADPWCFSKPEQRKSLLSQLNKTESDVLIEGDCIKGAYNALSAQQEISSSTLFLRGEESLIDEIETRNQDRLGLRQLHAYHAQLVRYEAGSRYKLHTDCHQTPNHKNNRAVSFLVYLLSVEEGEGGETVFPHLNIGVTPQQGAALIWNNLDEQGNCDLLTEHSSSPLRAGQKAIFQKWYYHTPALPQTHYDSVRCDESLSCRAYINSPATRQANRFYENALQLQREKSTDQQKTLFTFMRAVQAQPLHIPAVVSTAYLVDALYTHTDNVIKTDFVGVIKWFENVLRVFPIHTGSHFRLAELLAHHNMVDDAVKHYEAVAATEPLHNVDPLLRAANMCWRQGRNDLTDVLLKKALARAPDNKHVKEAMDEIRRQVRDL